MSPLVRSSLAGLSLLFAACTVGSLGDPGGGSGSGSDPGSGSGSGSNPGGGISGEIKADTTWSGTVSITGNVQIDPGVTVTVSSGTMIEGAAGATVHVQGTLNIAGAKGTEVTILPAQGVTTWPGFVADTGGTITMSYAMGSNIAVLTYCHTGATCNLDHVDFSQMGNAVVYEGTGTVSASRLDTVMDGGVMVMGGDLKIVDTYLSKSQGDFLIMNGGKLDMQYSEIGDTTGGYIHCDFHINSAAQLSITHSNIWHGVYGMMIGGTTGATVQYNNFIKNAAGDDIDPLSTNTTPNYEYNYFDQGVPTTTGFDFANAATAMITDAGPRAANL
jgi:hypothetical protein